MQSNYKNLDKKDLAEIWKQKFGTDPFPYLSRNFIVKNLIYQDQTELYGDLTLNSKKQLKKLVIQYSSTKTITKTDIKKSKTLNLNIGTKLIREFRNKKYEVIVVENGFEFEGKFYKSLSAIANEITGTRWNGKVFFGVKK